MIAKVEAGLHRNEGHEEVVEGCEAEVTALVVIDEFPIETINKILEDNAYESDTHYIWLADTYPTLPDSKPLHNVHGIQTPISKDWRSSFIGHTLQQVAAFIRNAPSPITPIDKEYSAVLRRDEYGNDGILICKIPPEGDDSEPQKIVTDPERLGMYFIEFNRCDWDVTYLVGGR